MIVRTGLRPERVWVMALLLAAAPAAAAPNDPGRLFFTPAQRAQLETARAHSAAPVSAGGQAADGETPPAQRYDGVVIRSDGRTIRWIDGRPQPDGSAVSGLKPGQMRRGGKVYEPYQVLPVAPARPSVPEAPAP